MTTTSTQHEPVGLRLASAMVLLLGGLFFSVYLSCNHLTSLRTGVGSFYFAWERHLPVVPWMILPYWSMDLFFVIAIFACRNRAQLWRHSQRVCLAIVLSAAGFLLFPLRFAFPRPQVEGGWGVAYQLLFGLDGPYNQAPSLHISLLMLVSLILIPALARQAWPRPLVQLGQMALVLWFVLIGLSTLFTYQHHCIDLIAGAAVGWACFWAVPEPRRP